MEQFGKLLREIRTARGWPLGTLAAKAGIGKATLSRWESGRCLPRLPELEAVLDALEVDAARRARLLAGLEAPRSVRRLRASDCGALPAAGDLLRALRQRGGWTQAQIAARMGVTQSAVTRWERGERTPTGEQIQALCFALDATEEEVVALTVGRYTDEQSQLPSEPEQVDACIFSLLIGRIWNVMELRFLTLERTLWQRAVQDAHARPHLATAYAVHAQYLSNHRRWDASCAMAQQALALSTGADRNRDAVARATLMVAAAEAHHGGSRAPHRAARRLEGWLADAPSPLYTAWAQSDMARYLAQAGEWEGALRLCRLATRHQNEDHDLRLIDEARLLMQMGMPADALDRLPVLSEGVKDNFVKEALTRCEALLQLGATSEAHDWLRRARSVLQTGRWDHLSPEADQLALRF